MDTRAQTLGLSGVRSMLGVWAGIGITMSCPGLWHPVHQTLGCLRVSPQAVSHIDLSVKFLILMS